MFAEHMKRGNPWDENPFGSHQRMDGNGNNNTSASSGTCSSEAGHFIPIRILEENMKNQLNDDDMDMEFVEFDPKQQPINRIEIPDCFKQANEDFRGSKVPRTKIIPPPLVQTDHLHGGRASSPFLDATPIHTPIHSPSYNNNSNNNTVRHIPITVEGIQKSSGPAGNPIVAPSQNKRNSPSRNNTPPPVQLEPIPMPAPPSASTQENKPPSPPPRSPKNKNAHLKFEHPNQPPSPSEDLKSNRSFANSNSGASAQNTTSAQNIPISNGNAATTPVQSPKFPTAPVQSPKFPNAPLQSPKFPSAPAQSPSFNNLNAQNTNFANAHAQSPTFNNLHVHNESGPRATSPKNNQPTKFNFNNVNAQPSSPHQANSSDESQSVPPPQKKPTPASSQLDKVEAVSQDVQQLEKQIKELVGNTKNKEYLYLDEMLTRNLIKLDNIETEGKENVRNARKACIKLIQKCIADLEAKLQVGVATKATSEPPCTRGDVNVEINLGEKKDPLPSVAAGDANANNSKDKLDTNKK